jgi:hypothetical protein
MNSNVRPNFASFNARAAPTQYIPSSRIVYTPYQNKVLKSYFDKKVQFNKATIDRLRLLTNLPRHKIYYWIKNERNKRQFSILTKRAPTNKFNFVPLLVPVKF